MVCMKGHPFVANFLFLLWIIGILPRLSKIFQASQLQDVVQNDLFPSADMIMSLKKEYGTEHWEHRVCADTEVGTPRPSVSEGKHVLLDTCNTGCTKQMESTRHKNFLQVCTLTWYWLLCLKNRTTHLSRPFFQDNIRKVHEQSEQLQKPKATVLRMEQSDSRPVYNYSIQTLNSRHQVKELLRKHMDKVCWMHSVCTLMCKGTSWWLKGQHKSVCVWVYTIFVNALKNTLRENCITKI